MAMASSQSQDTNTHLSPPLQSPPSPSRRHGAVIVSQLRVDQEKRLRQVDEWSQRCAVEEKDAHTEAMRLEQQLKAGLQSTSHLGSPNAFRTAICFDILTQLTAKYDRYDVVMGILQKEMARAVYVTQPPPLQQTTPLQEDQATRVQRFFGQRTFFTQLHQVLSKKAQLQSQLDRLDATHTLMLTQLRNQERMVDKIATRWARVLLKQTLVDWKKIIIRKKYTRVLLEKTSARWGKQRLLRLFRQWTQHAKTNKVARTRELLQQCADQTRDLEELLTRMDSQIESAKLETKGHREHYDFAKRQMFSLEELLAQLEVRVHNSNERKLQTIVNEWGRLCLTFVDCQIAYLQNMLDALPLNQYADASSLLVKGEELADLLGLPGDTLVLRWINFQLAKSETFQHYGFYQPAVVSPVHPSSSSFSSPSSSIGFMQNFGSDMKNNYVLRHILHRIVEQATQVSQFLLRRSDRRMDHVENKKSSDSQRMGSAKRKTAKPQQEDHGNNATTTPRIKVAPYPSKQELRVALEEQIFPPCPPFLCIQVLESETPSDLTFALFCFLASEHPTLLPTCDGTVLCPWSEAQAALNDAKTVWNTIRGQWTELQTPFAIREVVAASPDLTSPAHLLVKANIALQNAVNMVQYACSKRSVALKMWNCLQRTIQQDAMRVLLRRGRQEMPFDMLDRRKWREKYMLTTLHIPKLVDVFRFPHGEQEQKERHGAVGEQSPDPPPKTAEQDAKLQDELVQIEHILAEFYDELRRVYHYYASIDTELQRTDHLLRHTYHHKPVASGPQSSPAPIDRVAQDEERFFQKISMSMSLVEFHVFLKDCRVFGTSRPFPYAFIHQVFEQVNIELHLSSSSSNDGSPPTQSHGSSSPTSSPSKRLTEMTPAEFVEALVHVARSKYLRLRQPHHTAVAMQSLSLSQRFRRMLVDVVLPNAMQEKEKINVFHEQLLTTSCKEVVAKHQRELHAVYARFASLVAGITTDHRSSNTTTTAAVKAAKSYASMLTVDGLVVLLKHYDLLRESYLNLDDVQHILSEVLQLEREGIQINLPIVAACLSAIHHENEKDKESDETRDHPQAAETTTSNSSSSSKTAAEDVVLLTFPEFLEVVSAIACYLRPDAFVPLADKLDDFFTEELRLETASGPVPHS